MKPQYLAFEGIDGSGKDTQLDLLARRLTQEGVTPIVLFEPSFGVHGQEIRSKLHSLTKDIDEQRLLFTADRLDHVQTKIAPALAFVRNNPGFVILQNRSILSAAAYQPRGEGDDGLLVTIKAERSLAPMPDAIVILDVPVGLALERVAKQRRLDAIEQRSDQLAAARARYRRLADLIPGCHLIDGTGHPHEIAAHIYSVLRSQ